MKVREFLEKRKQKSFDRDSVNLWVAEDFHPVNPADVVIEPNKAARIDFRPFYGLNVYVVAPTYDESLVAMVERLKESARFILVAVMDFGEELGWKWSRETGVQSL